MSKIDAKRCATLKRFVETKTKSSTDPRAYRDLMTLVERHEAVVVALNDNAKYYGKGFDVLRGILAGEES